MTDKIEQSTSEMETENVGTPEVEAPEADKITLTKQELDRRVTNSAKSQLEHLKEQQAEENQQAIQNAVQQALAEQQMTAEEKAQAQFKREREQFNQERAQLNAEKQRVFIEKQLNANNLPLSLTNTLVNDKASNDDIMQAITDMKQNIELGVKEALNNEARVNAPVNTKTVSQEPQVESGLMGLKMKQENN